MGRLPGRATGESGEDVAPLWKLVEAPRGAREPPAGSLPRLGGAVRPEHSCRRRFPECGALAASEGQCPGVAPETPQPGAAWPRAVRDRRGSPAKPGPDLSRWPPAAGPEATGSQPCAGWHRGVSLSPSPSSCLAWGRRAWLSGARRQEHPRGELAGEQASAGENCRGRALAPRLPAVPARLRARRGSRPLPSRRAAVPGSGPS